MTEQSASQGDDANEKRDDAPSLVPGMPETTSQSDGASLEPAGHQPVPGKAEPARPSSNIMILWPERPEASDHAAFADDRADAHKPDAPGSRYRRRLAAMAAVVAVAAVCGAAGGSLATLALGHMTAPAPAVPPIKTAAAEETVLLRDAVARLSADLSGIKADLDRTGKTRTAQIAKLGERLEKVEKSQDDTVTKVGKLSEAQEKVQDKLRTAATAAAAPAPETTGSIAPAAAKTKPQIVDGWTLSRVSNGGAIVDGPMGLYEAYPGDPLPGLGRVDAVRYQDGRWVVVTPKGLIVHR